jgi:hypothetical protein
MASKGGHTFRCGHVKYCGDHVQMVYEQYDCHLCTVIKSTIRRIVPANRLKVTLVEQIAEGIADKLYAEGTQI